MEIVNFSHVNKINVSATLRSMEVGERWITKDADVEKVRAAAMYIGSGQFCIREDKFDNTVTVIRINKTQSK